jgi:hypothetical protein
MTKKELIKLLESIPDDVELFDYKSIHICSSSSLKDIEIPVEKIKEYVELCGSVMNAFPGYHPISFRISEKDHSLVSVLFSRGTYPELMARGRFPTFEFDRRILLDLNGEGAVKGIGSDKVCEITF